MKVNGQSIRTSIELRFDVSSQPSLRPRQLGQAAAQQQIAPLVNWDGGFAGEFAIYGIPRIPRGGSKIGQEHVSVNINDEHLLGWGFAFCHEKQ